MKSKHQFTAIVLLTGASLLLLPVAQAKDFGGYDAYEELSGTHANAIQAAQDGIRGREGMAGEIGVTGKMSMPAINSYDAYEELSGTHANKSPSPSGAQGRSGFEGQAGAAGKASGASPLFNLPGDVADGCSRYLRCAG
jgi:hypothetical protein